MMKYTDILFDLDGTLTDPGLGITNAVMHALRQFGIEVEDRRSLYPFVGPPLTASFEKYFHFSPEQAVKALEAYRVYFSETGIFENEVYAGIPELLQALTAAGCRLTLATSKPTVFARRILEHFALAQYFDTVIGSELNGERIEKAAVIRTALDALHIDDPARAVMVGDRCFDIEGAAANGLAAVGVLYGYGDAGELAAAAVTVPSVAALREYLLA